MILGYNENQFHIAMVLLKKPRAIIENLTLKKTEETINLSERHQIFNIVMGSGAQTLISLMEAATTSPASEEPSQLLLCIQ